MIEITLLRKIKDDFLQQLGLLQVAAPNLKYVPVLGKGTVDASGN